MTLKGDGTYLKVTKISRDKDNEERRAWVVSRLSFGGQGSWYCLQPTQQNKSKCLKMISVIWGKFTLFSIIAHENTRVILPTSPSSESLSFSSLFSFYFWFVLWRERFLRPMVLLWVWQGNASAGCWDEEWAISLLVWSREGTCLRSVLAARPPLSSCLSRIWAVHKP